YVAVHLLTRRKRAAGSSRSSEDLDEGMMPRWQQICDRSRASSIEVGTEHFRSLHDGIRATRRSCSNRQAEPTLRLHPLVALVHHPDAGSLLPQDWIIRLVPARLGFLMESLFAPTHLAPRLRERTTASRQLGALFLLVPAQAKGGSTVGSCMPLIDGRIV